MSPGVGDRPPPSRMVWFSFAKPGDFTVLLHITDFYAVFIWFYMTRAHDYHLLPSIYTPLCIPQI